MSFHKNPLKWFSSCSDVVAKGREWKMEGEDGGKGREWKGRKGRGGWKGGEERKV